MAENKHIESFEDFERWMFWLSVIFYTDMFLMLLWIIAKATGLINTPLWIELFPYITALIALFTAFIAVGRNLQKIKHLELDTAYIRKRQDRMADGLIRVEYRMNGVETRLGSIEIKLGNVENKLSNIEIEIAKLGTRMGNVERKLGI